MSFVALLLVGAFAVVLLLPAQVAREHAQTPDATAVPAQPTQTISPQPVLAAAGVDGDLAAQLARSSSAPASKPALGGTASPGPARDARPASAGETATPPLTAERQRARDAAELALRDAVALQVQLENAGVEAWGRELFETSYPLATAELAAADALMSAARFEQAQTRYREAARLLQRLQDNAPQRLQQSLQRGRESLQTEAAETAASDFTTALALDPSNAEARAGLEQARVRPTSLTELERGRALEAQDDLATAKQAYEAALRVEPEFTAAQTATEQVTARIRQRVFDKAIGDAIAALDAGRHGAAGKALSQARDIDPRSSQVAALAGRLATEKQQALLGRLREKATALESEEMWADAVALYDEALAVDATVAFAVNGRERAGSFAELHEQMGRYLREPQRLNSADPLARARSLLEAANRVRPAGPRLERERSQLARLVEAAAQPVTVTLSSDGQTQVTIQRIARLGAFAEHTIELRPGTYVAVGARPGYRDVRVVLEVSPGFARMRFDVRCRERI